MPATIGNHEQPAIDRHNEEWRVRILRQVSALLDDVEARLGFFGSVEVRVNYQGRVTTVETQIKQTLK